jgi:putative transposase
LQPHRQKNFKLSNDPFFVEKVRDIVGLYLNPPENAVVLCVDEKSGIQALERTQPTLPLGLGYVEGVTHDYRRHGTTTLFAALDTANGKVLTKRRQRHRHQEYLSFLREIEKNVPKNLEVHIIVDNYATHKHFRVRRWFATRPRVAGPRTQFSKTAESIDPMASRPQSQETVGAKSKPRWRLLDASGEEQPPGVRGMAA